jgi:predicted amidohydrolase
MKIAVLQFSPELGEVERNIAQANNILAQTPLDVPRDNQPLWLVLPELAFSGIFKPHIRFLA